ncbi:MAG: monofunctional biosynthetic peptidoglycan transglycosylase [Prevotellaceae bacterium]|jgi:monofunctional biosynthetic peptidoglycan transglycosylase|nr:monofunctional biosynthetic peptidoglycan transglycosylase [Prevotellaceae bacterium]
MKRMLFHIFKRLGKFALWYLIITVGLVVVLRFVPVYVTPYMLRCSLQSLIEGRSPKWKHTWMPIEEIAPALGVAVIASEDNRFVKHHGFEFESIRKVYAAHRKHGKRLRGGSTISQQTAKNIFTFGTRTWVRKGFETWFTVLIELFWSKERIMEVYLNSIEMGRGVFGAEAAAQTYFGIPAARLSREQAALTAAVLPNPKRFKINHPSAYILRRQTQILRLMPKMGRIDFLSHKQ